MCDLPSFTQYVCFCHANVIDCDLGGGLCEYAYAVTRVYSMRASVCLEPTSVCLYSSAVWVQMYGKACVHIASCFVFVVHCLAMHLCEWSVTKTNSCEPCLCHSANKTSLYPIPYLSMICILSAQDLGPVSISLHNSYPIRTRSRSCLRIFT